MNKLNFCTKCIVHIWCKENKEKKEKLPPSTHTLTTYKIPFILPFKPFILQVF